MTRIALHWLGRLLQTQPWLRQLADVLKSVSPSAHARLRRISRSAGPASALSTVWKAPDHLAGTAHPASSGTLPAGLPNLELPDAYDASPAGADGNPSSTLDPVVDIAQMRQSPGSVCFVVIVTQEDTVALERTLQSVLRQTDPDWELLLCGEPAVHAWLSKWMDIDWRVRRFSIEGRLHEVQVLQRASVQATTHFVGLLSQGDLLDDDMVKLLGGTVRARPDADLVYTDEATQLDTDRVGRPFYKPDWSPEHQHSVHVLGRFLAIRKALLLRQPLVTERSSTVAEYALGTELSLQARRICHVDEPLYIRKADDVRPFGGFFPPDALQGARGALERIVRREDPRANVATREPGSLHVDWPVPEDAPVTLLILSGMQKRELPGHGEVTLATHFVRSIIARSSSRNYSIVVVDDGEVDAELADLLRRHGHRSRSCPRTTPFSFAHKANFATSLVDTGIVILLNDDLEVDSPDWIQALAGQAARPSVGVAGCRLLYGDGTLQHAGIVLGLNGSAGHVFHRLDADGREYAGFASIDRNYSAVTGAVMAYRKETFDRVGGFDERFRTDYNDVDFCLKCIGLGLRVVYTPSATLYHFHNSSLKRIHDNAGERELFLERWHATVEHDPYFSKNFQARTDDQALVQTR